ncbi:sensor histidine kinase [Anaerosphaera multitolerans]|uniref:histidine kinase n=1 Tax=Anaerosphaera multitolerans TaxID=2487351 RepID=A0A437S5V8_9FIRM|nr:HAMP domain-containing sensor histidine kinase [Anaerosphaera multitolerans]RVU54432.1 sensor histidine kinase [Anaerosphaera multitolerans]
MQVLANQKIKQLFLKMFSFIILFLLISVVLIKLDMKNSETYILISAFCMSFLILTAIYRYFKEQSNIIKNAITQIKSYTSGNTSSRIKCDEEGELYLLFHEVNSLVSILNTHIEKEKETKVFLKDTISDISHQLKTPLAALNVYNGIVQEEAAQLPLINEFANLSEKELNRIETLVQNLLKITKLDAGTIVIEKNIENVSDIMNDIQKHFQYRIKQEDKTLSLLGDDIITIPCDRIWFTEAISNIVKNAIDHTEKGDTIYIEWKQFASIVQITIRDNGRGIHPEDLHFIFKRFYRSRFSKDTQGIGLGLSLAKSIIEAHSGTIKVDSELGIGTTFTIDFLIPTKL